MRLGAMLSPCGLFRYLLWRTWDESLPVLVYVMLNPSKADASIGDPTIGKCIGFAELLGFGGILVVNLFAYRATNPRDLKRSGWLVGADNDDAITAAVLGQPYVICAWGANARGHARAAAVLDLLRSVGVEARALRCLADGTPEHPLYIPYACKPVPL
jgi:hypothetical protein